MNLRLTPHAPAAAGRGQTRRLFLLNALAGAALVGCGGNGHTPVPDLLTLTAAQAAADLAARRYTAEALAAACLAHIDRWEPHYNAFTWLNPRVLDQAREVDRQRAAGAELGPLAGLPVVIKETMDHRDAPSTLGWQRLSPAVGGIELRPTAHALVVSRLLSAGAVIIGKGNVPAFSDDGTRAASSWDGPTYNAVARMLAPGASSSGVATAVAAGFALLGVGEETGGSIQNPAGAQSLVGLTPTFGLVPTQGVAPLAGSTRDVVGPIARTVEDAALLLDALVPEAAPAGGWRTAVQAAGWQGRRVGSYGPGWRHEAMSSETASLYGQALEHVRALGATVVSDPFAGSGLADLALADEPYDYRGTESAAYDLDRYVQGLGLLGLSDLIGRAGASPFGAGQPLHWYAEALPLLQASLADPSQAPDLGPFTALRAAYRERFLDVMQAQQLDLLLLPQRLDVLPGVHEDGVIAESSVSALNIAGLPGLTLPAGRHPSNGSPMAVIAIGRPGSEALLLALGHAFEQGAAPRLVAHLRDG
jgi:amidase/aspartyl-tRNA(Asn)/glutamyl-tRNA(Gln) amidotransferase subunit A